MAISKPTPRLALVLMLLACLALGATSANVIYRLTHQVIRANPSTPSSTRSQRGGLAPFGSNPSSTDESSSTPLNGTAIEAKVDPAIVDINTTLSGGGDAAGTGMVITPSGVVLTNNHVVEGATSIVAQIGGGTRDYTAKILGTDRSDDIALIQIQAVSALKTVAIGDSSAVSVGDAITALGNALGRGGAPAAAPGTITALNQQITADDGLGNAETLAGLIETNADIEPGDSGGPLVDSSGNVIGMDTAAAFSRRFRRVAGTSAGYAIPINTAMTVARAIESGKASSTVQIGERGILGVTVTDGNAQGATVVGVESGSPAESAGIAAGDVITGLDGKAVDSADSLSRATAGHHPGDRVSVAWVDRSGVTRHATLKLIAGPPA